VVRSLPTAGGFRKGRLDSERALTHVANGARDVCRRQTLIGTAPRRLGGRGTRVGRRDKGSTGRRRERTVQLGGEKRVGDALPSHSKPRGDRARANTGQFRDLFSGALFQLGEHEYSPSIRVEPRDRLGEQPEPLVVQYPFVRQDLVGIDDFVDVEIAVQSKAGASALDTAAAIAAYTQGSGGKPEVKTRSAIELMKSRMKSEEDVLNSVLHVCARHPQAAD